MTVRQARHSPVLADTQRETVRCASQKEPAGQLRPSGDQCNLNQPRDENGRFASGESDDKPNQQHDRKTGTGPGRAADEAGAGRA